MLGSAKCRQLPTGERYQTSTELTMSANIGTEGNTAGISSENNEREVLQDSNVNSRSCQRAN